MLMIFSTNAFLNLAVEHLNSTLIDLKTILDIVSFEVAPEKCNSVIFTRRRYIYSPNVYYLLITYLGITLDTKLRYNPYITSLSATISQ